MSSRLHQALWQVSPELFTWHRLKFSVLGQLGLGTCLWIGGGGQLEAGRGTPGSACSMAHVGFRMWLGCVPLPRVPSPLDGRCYWAH